MADEQLDRSWSWRWSPRVADELLRREDRQAKIREAIPALQVEAAEPAEQRSWARSAERGDNSVTTQAPAQSAAEKMVPKLKPQRSVTGPDQAVHARRKVIIVPVFGQLTIPRNPKQLLPFGPDGTNGTNGHCSPPAVPRPARQHPWAHTDLGSYADGCCCW